MLDFLDVRISKRYWMMLFSFLVCFGACRQHEGSDLKELKGNSGRIKLSDPAGNVRSAFADYTIYENGQIQMHGDITYLVPGTNYEITVPFHKAYHTQAKNVLSSSYKHETPANFALPIDRLDVSVLKVDPWSRTTQLSARIARQTRLVDQLYGADRLDIELDLSQEIIRFKSVKIFGGFIFAPEDKAKVDFARETASIDLIEVK